MISEDLGSAVFLRGNGLVVYPRFSAILQEPTTEYGLAPRIVQTVRGKGAVETQVSYASLEAITDPARFL